MFKEEYQKHFENVKKQKIFVINAIDIENTFLEEDVEDDYTECITLPE